MKIRCGQNMGYAGTDSQWTEEIPEDVVEAGSEAIEEYLEEARQLIWEAACQKISVWAEIEEEE